MKADQRAFEGPAQTIEITGTTAAESRFLSTSTLSMVRTECCESFRTCGTRCANCPNRPENREAVTRYKEEAQRVRLGRRFTLDASLPAGGGATETASSLTC